MGFYNHLSSLSSTYCKKRLKIMTRYTVPFWTSLGTALQLFSNRQHRETGLDVLQRDHNHIMFENRHWLM